MMKTSAQILVKLTIELEEVKKQMNAIELSSLKSNTAIDIIPKNDEATEYQSLKKKLTKLNLLKQNIN